MSASSEPAAPAAPPTAPKARRARAPRRPNPRVEQYRRTWYFLRRNTLALIGLGIILCLVGVAIFALFQPIAWYAMPQYCASNQTNPTTTNNTAQNPFNIPIDQVQTGLPNGTYSWTAQSKGFVANPSFGDFQVQGKDVVVPIRFAVANPTSSSPGVPQLTQTPTHTPASTTEKRFAVTFTSSGLPRVPFTGWEVTINFTSPSECLTGTSEPVICTYPQGSASPGPNCYQTPTLFPSVIAPTLNLATLQGGPLPLGAITQGGSSGYFYNLYNGLLRGTDWSLTISVSIVGVGAMLGLLIGAIAGFYGGVVDEALMRLVDIFLSIPQLLFVLIVVAAVSLTVHQIPPLNTYTTKIFLLIVAFIIVWWPFYSRIVRGQVLVVREQKYVEAARASGATGGRIVRRHIIPNSLFPVFIQMSLDVGTIPLLTGALVFLGFNIFPSVYFPEWGSISALGVVQLEQFLSTCEAAGGCVVPWWQIAFPGIILFLFAISVNFLSDGLRDALDPRLRR